MSGPSRDFWEGRFRQGDTPWDRGGANPQLLAWLESGRLRPCRILVPGCGSGYEVAALAGAGFEVTGLDYAEPALARSRTQLRGRPATLVQADALQWDPAERFDAIYEQTCLCALYPDHWRAYADRLHGWLRPRGSLYALLMQALRPGAADGMIEGPPYHCDINAMRALFPEPRWSWPKPPYSRSPHPRGIFELAVVLERRD